MSELPPSEPSGTGQSSETSPSEISGQVRLRVLWLAGLACVCLGVLAHTGLRPHKRNLLLGQQPYQFPAELTLPGWQRQQSQALAISDPNQVLAAHQYQFQRQGKVIQAKIFYLRYVEGNVSRYLNLYTPVSSTLVQRQIFQPQTGHASLVVSGQRLYLSSCINPQGLPTTTEAQFARNRYQNDLNPGRISLWMLGQQDLMDRRCLFTALSMPLATPNASPASPTANSANGTANPIDPAQLEANQKILEAFWEQWQPWWQSQFPPS
jgi:cyanosortase A-associated protein